MGMCMVIVLAFAGQGREVLGGGIPGGRGYSMVGSRRQGSDLATPICSE